MATAVKHKQAAGFTAVIAYRDDQRRWSVTVNDGPDSPTGIGRGDAGESFDVVLDAAIDDLTRQRKALAHLVIQ